MNAPHGDASARPVGNYLHGCDSSELISPRSSVTDDHRLISKPAESVRVWEKRTTIVCTADRHDTIAAYKNRGCRCPDATRRAVEYERKRERGLIAPTQPASLTMRRLQALAVIGWPSDQIAAMVKRNPVSISQLRRGAHAMVTGRTERAVHKVYRRLHDQPGPSTRTRSYAARQGWGGPTVLLWYADIDEVAVARACMGEVTSLTRAERLASVEHLRRNGTSYDDIAERLHTSARQVHRDLSDLGLVLEATA